MTVIYFIRHGEFENPEKIVPWRLPGFPLSKKGIKDIEKVAEFFKNIKVGAIYSSPILRAKQSADILGKKLNIKVNTSHLIEEIYTPLQDRRITYEELFRKRTIPYLEKFHIKNKGENYNDIFHRVAELVISLLKNYQGRNIVLVSHGDPIMIYWLTLLGKPILLEDLLDGRDYIPKAGILKLVFDRTKLIKAERVNF